MEFVQKFTPLDFQVKNFTPSILPNFNSFSKKKNKKWVKMEKFTLIAKNLYCRRHWRDGQIPPLYIGGEFLNLLQYYMGGGVPIYYNITKGGRVLPGPKFVLRNKWTAPYENPTSSTTSMTKKLRSSRNDSLFLISIPTPTLYTLNFTQVQTSAN